MAATQKGRARLLAEYTVFRAVVAVVQALPPGLGYAVADFLAWVAYSVFGKLRRTALENVRVAFPELSPGAGDRLVRATYRHFLRAVIELALVPRKVRVTTWRRFAAYPGSSPLRAALASPRPVLVASGHLGNWELAGIASGLLGYRLHAIARVLDNPHVERYARRLRRMYGMEVIAKKGEFDRLAEVLAGGGKVATLADLDAGERGLFVDFFGRPASAHKAVALLALKYDAPVVVIGVPRADRADHPQDPARDPRDGLERMYYEVRVEEVIDPREYAGVARVDAVRDITRRYMAAVERMIRRHPEQYYWFRPRWKTRPAKAGPAETRAA